MIRILGFGLVAAAAACASGVWHTDRQLQAYRRTEAPSSSYVLVPLRIRRELYRPEAGQLVDRAWKLIGAMYGLAILGMILIVAGS